MGVARRKVQDVVLVAGGAKDVAPDGSSGTGIPPGDDLARGTGDSPGRASGLPARLWWLVAAVLVLVVAVGMVVADRREAARTAARATVPGILAPLTGPVSGRWSSPVVLDPLSRSRSESRVVAGRLVVQVNPPDGGVDVVALDLATGAEAWRTPVARLRTDPLATRCVQPGPPDESTPPSVVCVAADQTASLDTEAGYARATTKARLLVIDAATGAVVSEGPTDPTTSVSALGTDLVIGRVDAGGHVQVTRKDPRATGDRWTFTSPVPIPVDRAGRRSATVYVVGSRVVAVSSGSWWLLSDSGELIRSWTGPQDATGGVQWLTKTTQFTDAGATPDGIPRTDAVVLATGRTFTAEGYPAATTVDDGSLAELTLMQSQANLVAHDAESGLTRWTTPIPADASMMVVDGQVICAGTTELRSIDGKSGQTLWTTPVSQPDQTARFTDGTVVVITELVQGSGQAIAAYGLDDGKLRWRANLANGQTLFAVDGRLYAQGSQELTSLG